MMSTDVFCVSQRQDDEVYDDRDYVYTKIELVKSNKSSDTRGVTESTVLGLTEKLKTLENEPSQMPLILSLINDKAPMESPNFSGRINFEGCVYTGMAITVADLSGQLLNDFQVINNRLDNIEIDRGIAATRIEEVAVMETTDPVFNITELGNGKTMNDIVTYYAPTTDLSSYVTISHFESIYDGIDSRFTIVDATMQGNKIYLQNQITNLDGRFNFLDANIQGNQNEIQNIVSEAQGHTQQITTQNNRLNTIDNKITSISNNLATNTNTIGGMGNAITMLMQRFYSDDRLKKKRKIHRKCCYNTV